MTQLPFPKKPVIGVWIHRWALLTAFVAVLALLSGAFVTTFRVGMADPIWPTYPWHLLLISWSEPSAGFLIEHTHRLADYTLGLCVMVLAGWLWMSKGHRSRRWLGTVALAMVIFQGLLGGLRVKLNELVGTDLAFLHGCFAQLVFAVLICLALITSKSWPSEIQSNEYGSSSMAIRRCAFFATACVFLQLVSGGVVRHTYSRLGMRAHLLMAFVAVAATVCLVTAILGNQDLRRRLALPILMVVGLIAIQLGLGTEAWMIRFSGTFGMGMPEPTMSAALVRTAHFLVGSFIFATLMAITLRASRTSGSILPNSRPTGQLEGAA